MNILQISFGDNSTRDDSAQTEVMYLTQEGFIDGCIVMVISLIRFHGEKDNPPRFQY